MKAYWQPKAQKSAPVISEMDSLQHTPVVRVEESSEAAAKRPSRLRALTKGFRRSKQSKGTDIGRDTRTSEGTAGPVDPNSQPQPTGGDTKRTHGTGAVIDNLALAASIVESISDAINKFPFVGPVVGLLSQILKKCREIKDMHEQRDVLVARLTKTAGDLHGTIMRMEANNCTDSTGRLKADIEEYVGLLQQASALMSDFDGQGRLRTALQMEWVGKFTALDRELDLFGSHFNVSTTYLGIITSFMYTACNG
ncbi:hypothetical protein C8J57DRAFT_666255 [Mycena rebaudengoi]|nr:hypothetical protein C8J57DRAFT_666255 [Mycena rebaudengoi]